MNEKTNAMRRLDSLKIPYKEYTYTHTDAISGTDVASALGQNSAQVFKTLVTTGKTGAHYVFIVPVANELDLKKGAQHVGEKYIEMLPAKDLLPLTGYVHGGCSPIGMKKAFKTTIDATAQGFESIIFSGGKIGYQVEVSLQGLKKALVVRCADIVK